MGYIEAMQKMTSDRVEEARKVHREAAQTGCMTCPAANVNSNGLFCGIEEVQIVPESDPHTVIKLCNGQYQDCPSWRTNRDSGDTASSYTAAARKRLAAAEDQERAWFADYNERYGK